MTHQCTLLVMQSHSQNACSTCMLVQQGSSSFLGVNMTPVKTGEHSTQHLYYQLSPVLLIFIWHRQRVVYRVDTPSCEVAQGMDALTLPVLRIKCLTHHMGKLALLSRHTPASEPAF